jgi:hypothetical protein
VRRNEGLSTELRSVGSETESRFYREKPRVTFAPERLTWSGTVEVGLHFKAPVWALTERTQVAESFATTQDTRESLTPQYLTPPEAILGRPLCHLPLCAAILN